MSRFIIITISQFSHSRDDGDKDMELLDKDIAIITKCQIVSALVLSVVL